jgi:hypothetical protein
MRRGQAHAARSGACDATMFLSLGVSPDLLGILQSTVSLLWSGDAAQV